MLTNDSSGIWKYILDRLMQIHDQIIIHAPEYRELLERADERKRKIAADLVAEGTKLLEDWEAGWL